MTNFHDLFAYNDWANQQLLALTDQMTAEQLDNPMPELGGSTLGLFTHLAQVEAVFLAVMSGHERPSPRSFNYEEVKALLRDSADGYRERLAVLIERSEESFHVPWFGRDFTIEQGLTQVATHSVQHRAGIAAGIAKAGLEAPILDYIAWAARHR